ncbi:hypothetical protein [Myroides injenensis]|uniref:hypothetical protein n=1 Tax=Myroides injenensis TaxID=1183151 RepID=UPI0003103E63|nr:hypothetical protein [Myroides injenensis]
MTVLKILLSVLLSVLGGYMIYLGIKADMLPPTLTGVGFFLIAIIFNLPKEKK